MVDSGWRSAAGRPCIGHRSRRLTQCARRPTCGCIRRSSLCLGRVRSWHLAPRRRQVTAAAAQVPAHMLQCCGKMALTPCRLSLGAMPAVCHPCCICSRFNRLMHAGHGHLVMVQRPARRQQQNLHRELCDTGNSLRTAASACSLYQGASDTNSPPYADVGPTCKLHDAQLTLSSGLSAAGQPEKTAQ